MIVLIVILLELCAVFRCFGGVLALLEGLLQLAPWSFVSPLMHKATSVTSVALNIFSL